MTDAGPPGGRERRIRRGVEWPGGRRATDSPLPRRRRPRLSLRDLVAGLSVALLAIPQSLAYAELAGLPGHHGLYAVSIPLVAAALFASSPYLQTGPVATTALLTFGALVPLAEPGSAEFVRLAALLALVVGVVRVALGTMRLGWLSYLMSRPVLEGFMLGAAVLIVASQVPAIVGVTPEPGRGVLWNAVHAAAWASEWDPASIGFGLGTIAVIVAARVVHPAVPGVVVATLAGLALSISLGFDGPVVGDVPERLPPLTPALPWRRLPSLVLPGLVIALVGFAEASSIARTFASRDRMRWDPDREFIGQGAANLAAGLFGGFPVGGSFARSGLNRLAGATSRWSGLVTGLAVLAFLPFAGVLAPLPKAVLAGVVVAAVANLLVPRSLLQLWPVSRPQAFIGVGTFALTLALSPHIDQAVVVGIVAAGAVHLWRELNVDLDEECVGRVLHLAPRGVLWFASVPRLDDQIRELVSDYPFVHAVVIHCDGLGRIDLTGALGLAEIVEELRDAGLDVTVEAIPDHAARVLAGVVEVEMAEPEG